MVYYDGIKKKDGFFSLKKACDEIEEKILNKVKNKFYCPYCDSQMVNNEIIGKRSREFHMIGYNDDYCRIGGRSHVKKAPERGYCICENIKCGNRDKPVNALILINRQSLEKILELLEDGKA